MQRYFSVGISTLESFNVAGNYIASKVGSKKPTVAVVGIETPAGISGAKEFGESMEKLGWKVKVYGKADTWKNTFCVSCTQPLPVMVSTLLMVLLRVRPQST